MVVVQIEMSNLLGQPGMPLCNGWYYETLCTEVQKWVVQTIKAVKVRGKKRYEWSKAMQWNHKTALGHKE